MENAKDAKSYLVARFIEQGDYTFLPEGLLEEMVEKLIALDEAFMRQSGVEEGAPYDDEAACAAIFEDMAKAFPAHRMYMMRITEDYLDFNEEYLESIGAIDWE